MSPKKYETDCWGGKPNNNQEQKFQSMINNIYNNRIVNLCQ